MEIQSGLTNEQQPRLKLTNEMLVSLEILSLPIGEVLLILEKECQENPFLEINLISNNIGLESNPSDYWSDSEYESFDWIPAQKESFLGFVDQQIKVMFSGISYQVSQDIINNLSPLGFLELSPEEIAIKNNISVEEVNSIRKEFMSLEGLGISAQNYQEYITFLLSSLREGSIIKEDVENYVILAISDPRRAKIEYEQIHNMIKSIPPYPSYSFEDIYEKISLVDAVLVTQEDRFEVEIFNEPEILFLNKEYLQLIKSSNHEAREFLNNKYQRAKILIRAIYKRNETLRGVIRFISNQQKLFLTGNSSFPISLTEQQVGKGLKIHQTTVSRAIKNKVIKTPRGFVSLKSLLTTGSTRGDKTRNQILHEVSELFRAFPEMKDKEVSNYLKEKKGIEVARRTISKYRQLLGATKKRKRDNDK
ncbi:MAG: RNA polymerase sigma-54 factor [candidate division WS2 bacterium]|nr:RNA polymerase sigma-54 factor [Candidatus Psychracetigena formicireducens]